MIKSMFLKSTIWALIIFLFPTVAGLIGVMIIPKMWERSQSQYTQTQKEMNCILDALKKFKYHINRYPTEEEGLLILKRNMGLQNWKGPYLELTKFTDSWGNEYKYFLLNGKPFILSLGPNKVQDTSLLQGKIKQEGDDLIVSLNGE